MKKAILFASLFLYGVASLNAMDSQKPARVIAARLKKQAAAKKAATPPPPPAQETFEHHVNCDRSNGGCMQCNYLDCMQQGKYDKK